MDLQEIKQSILRGNIPTKQDLLSIHLSSLRNIDVRTPEQAAIIQEVFDEQMSKLPPEVKVSVNDIMVQMDKDVQHMTPEKEAEFQKIIDERVNASRVKAPIDVKIENANEELKEQIGQLKTQIKQLIDFFNEIAEIEPGIITKVKSRMDITEVLNILREYR